MKLIGPDDVRVQCRICRQIFYVEPKDKVMAENGRRVLTHFVEFCAIGCPGCGRQVGFRRRLRNRQSGFAERR